MPTVIDRQVDAFEASVKDALGRSANHPVSDATVADRSGVPKTRLAEVMRQLEQANLFNKWWRWLAQLAG
jgi:hypothetical protein